MQWYFPAPSSWNVAHVMLMQVNLWLVFLYNEHCNLLQFFDMEGSTYALSVMCIPLPTCHVLTVRCGLFDKFPFLHDIHFSPTHAKLIAYCKLPLSACVRIYSVLYLCEPDIVWLTECVRLCASHCSLMLLLVFLYRHSLIKVSTSGAFNMEDLYIVKSNCFSCSQSQQSFYWGSVCWFVKTLQGCF